ncbi:MAG: bacillithiol biosynthesis deacetylase BshB1 [Salibacteraceae bacterium]
MKLDILAFAAHPDDVELAASGSVLKHVKNGYSVGIVDLTRGELGTRGSAEIRDAEAKEAAKILGLSARVNLDLGDGFFENNKENLLRLVEQIRVYQPEIVWCNAITDRHPDHQRGSELASRACFLAGLRKIETKWNGENQNAWRPKSVYHYIQDHYIKPDFVVNVSDEWSGKMDSIMAYSSQFYNPNSKEPVSPISSKEFLQVIEGRGREMGRMISREYGEGFTVERPIGIDDLMKVY